VSSALRPRLPPLDRRRGLPGRRASPAPGRPAILLLPLLAACPAPPAPHPLPFDPAPAAAAESAPASFPAEGLDEEGSETEARWGPPNAPRIAGEWRADGAVRAPVVILRGACERRSAEDCGCTDDLLLVAALDGSLTAFEPSGARRWRYGCGAPISQPPLPAPGEAVFVRCDDGTIAALDERDGMERWRVARPAEAGLVTGLAWSPWAGLLFAADRTMAAVHRSGAVAWTLTDAGPFLGRPALSGRLVVFAGLDRLVHGVDPEGGEELWRRWVVGGVEGDVLERRSGDVVVATLYGRVYDFALPGGEQRWEATVGELVRGAPAEGTDGTILVPVMDGAVAGLDPETGALRWGFGVPAPVRAAPLPVRGREDVPGTARAVFGDRDGFLVELAYTARGADDSAGAAAPPRELWRLNVGLPLEARPTLRGAELLVGLEDGRVVRVAPGPPDCTGDAGAAAEESR